LKQKRAERRISAILAADVVGYSRLMGTDDEGTLSQLKGHHNTLVEPKIREYRGHIVRTTGDGLLVLFASVVEALRCAIEIQRGMIKRNARVPAEKRIAFRMGINVGDIIIDGVSVHGDGVNVAARLEALADIGGICVSRRVQEDAHGTIDVTFEDTGEQQLKNIARLVHVFRVRLEGAAEAAAAAVPALPNKPSIAVLPFTNMSDDPNQDYFADGIAEDITTALSRVHALFVIARNSSFTYKGRAVDITRVGRELGVRYVLEGSVRKAGTQVRVSGQLIDASTGAHLWADRMDGALDDIFALQDRITTSVVGAILTKLEQAEIKRAQRKPTGSLDAYDFYLRAMANVHHWTKEGISEALRLFYQAIKLDPEYGSAYGMAAWCYLRRRSDGWMTDRVQESAEAARLARLAAKFGKDDAVALSRAGFALAFVVDDVDAGADLVERAVLLNPNLAEAWYFSSRVRVLLDEPEVAIEHAARAMRLSPLDPLTFLMQYSTALAHFHAGRYEEAGSWAEKARRANANFLPALRVAAASFALAGKLAKAAELTTHLREADPSLTISGLAELNPFRRPNDFAEWVEGLREAGLPN
jgi:TolB-like protein/tetratricopeptide (TPR) repeat protein